MKLDFEDGSFLTERIIAWGFARVVETSHLKEEEYPGKLGIEPLQPEFTLEEFSRRIIFYPKTIKEFFITQRQVSGIGNGYLQDILYCAGMHPKRKGNSLSGEEKTNLLNAVQDILNNALASGGRISEVDLFNTMGKYVPYLFKETFGKPCQNCCTSMIKQNVLGTASYYCPTCQPL